MRLDPRHLEILAAIVDHGGLTEGAEALGKSQPSVSRTLSQLESRIGVPLFHPGRRPLQPTELGQALADQGRSVLKANATASDVVARHLTGHAGTVRVGGTPIFMDGVVSAMIAMFQQQMSDVRVDQSYGYAEALIDRLRNGALDLAILPMGRNKVPGDLTFQPILPGLNIIACREGHPLARKRLITPDEISKYPWIAPPTDSPLYRDLRRALTDLEVENFRISFSGGSLASVIEVLTGSDSLTVLPYSVVFMIRKRNAITALPLEISHPERALGLLYEAPRNQSPAARRFFTFVVAQFESLSRRIVQQQKDRLWR
jgi:DNA-binding transcriptional LysR family regulator